ncbi:hypothetical protein [Legionella hackeliae]|uniref:Transmembrane protein n=1 Tax=Legionella hackeliae TaxID=449 RepID=A0A0A8UV88_LEGHA|nr:hypothetical protein [Legionella hackeliae]KTD15194.1 hypothetical protein Lhac_0036 [Legionella hackeliae]CEK11441.1 conserved exported protein of unknown function [Legionella hackeliae]STX48213.1 Uncharacterised protein [Legionella hackeliae]
MATRKSLVLIVLMMVFAAPGLVAYLFFTHPQWLGAATTNRGVLLNPSIRFVKINDKEKWRLILWNPGACDKNCLEQLDKLARIRLALGRHLYEVDQWLITDETVELPASLLHLFKEEDIQVRRLSQEEHSQFKILNAKSQVFIANPDDYLILTYAQDAKPDAIFHDIKHLLSVDKKNG